MTETPIELRSVVAADVRHFFEHAQDVEAIRMAAPGSAATAWPEFSRRWESIRSSDAFFCRSVIFGGDIAGYIAKFTQMDVPSVSYWFDRRFWGRGLAREALRLFLREVPARQLYARVASGNVASLRVLASNGFRPIDTGSYFSAAIGEDVEEIVMCLDPETSSG